MSSRPRYPGIRVTANGNQLVGIFYPITHRFLFRHLVLLCVERRKACRMLQSKAGVENREYKVHRSILADVDAGRLSKDELFTRGEEILRERVKGGVVAPGLTGHRLPPLTPPVGPVVPPARAANRLRRGSNNVEDS